LVVAAGSAGNRIVVSAARVPVEGESTRVYTTLSSDLFDAPSALDKLGKAAMATPAVAPAGIGEPPPAGTLAFGPYFLGLKPPPPKAVDVTPLPPEPLWSRPWVWGVAAGAALAVGSGTYLLTRPPARKPGVAVTVTLPE